MSVRYASQLYNHIHRYNCFQSHGSRLTFADSQCLQHTIHEELPAQVFPARLDLVDALAIVGHLGPRGENRVVVGVFKHCRRLSRQNGRQGVSTRETRSVYSCSRLAPTEAFCWQLTNKLWLSREVTFFTQQASALSAEATAGSH